MLEHSIRLRNPYVDPMSLIQVELLRRKRAAVEAGSPSRPSSTAPSPPPSTASPQACATQAEPGRLPPAHVRCCACACKPFCVSPSPSLPASLAPAQVTLPHALGYHMVLQRDAPIHIWGWAAPGEAIDVALAARTGPATTDRWAA